MGLSAGHRSPGSAGWPVGEGEDRSDDHSGVPGGRQEHARAGQPRQPLVEPRPVSC